MFGGFNYNFGELEKKFLWKFGEFEWQVIILVAYIYDKLIKI